MRRTAAAVCLVLAPITLAVATAVDPALGAEDQSYGIYRDNPGAIEWHSVLLHWAWVLFVPGLIGLLDPIRKRGAVLARIAWIAVVFGLVTFAALMASDLMVLALEQNLPNDKVKAVDEAFQAMAWAQWGWQVPGLLGWAVALLLTPIAAARARVINWWTAGAALAGTAGYFLFAISPVPLCLVGPAVMTGAYAVAGWQLRRVTPPAEPDSFGAFRFTVGRLCMVLAPVSFGVGLATVPGLSADTAGFLEHPALAQASAFFLHLSWVLFIPAVLTATRDGGRFARIAGFVTVLALANFSALMAGDYGDLAARQTLDQATADKVQASMGEQALFTFAWVLPSMAGTLLGLILVAVATTVDGRSRWWVPVLVSAGIAAFLVLGVGPLSLVSPALLLAGFGLLARSLRFTSTPSPAPAPAPVPAG
ncbi:hypothetical protein Drose_27945 [Dactylosporangium roseum]|uniref:Uncharacterized protein n=1 Tax=Dactylosporangium roseum TaxID=47989 RepID=A0ABY5Z273_9ACTN|nr:hypothetical protein [Dactylosporangium roseum]UWZ34977.1 hypothetical protein Drose_27945 [Dactylosporangium roseum]